MCLLAILFLLSPFGLLRAAGDKFPELTRPLSKVEALNLALAKDGTIREARKEVEAAAGVAIQTRAILFPKLLGGASYSVRQDSLIETNEHPEIPALQLPIPAAAGGGSMTIEGAKFPKINNQSWDADKRLDVLQYALKEAVEQWDVDAICRLADKARATTVRLAAENIADALPSTRELHGDIVIHDDAERGKVVIQFPTPASQETRRWVQMCGFFGSGDGATFWRKRTFRRGENMALDRARHCVGRVLEDRRKLEAAQQPAVEPAAATTVQADPFTW